MKKTAVTIIFFLFYHLIQAQIQSGNISYRVEVMSEKKSDGKEIKDPKIRKEVLNGLYKYDHIMGFLNYEMNFSSDKAVFNRVSSMANDNGYDLEKASSNVGIIGDYYIDIKNNQRIHHHYFLGKTWLLKGKIDDLEWYLHDETKEIEGYVCRKATAIINLNDIKKGEITAWFAPDLPFQYGPKGYGGLPGLILGLEIRHYYIYAHAIKLSNDEKNIYFPTNGEVVDWDTYNKETDKLLPWKR